MSANVLGSSAPMLAANGVTVDYSASEFTHLIAIARGSMRKTSGSVLTSILTGRRHFVYKGDYSEYDLTVVHNNRSAGPFDDHIEFLNTCFPIGSLVRFWPASDAPQVFDCIVTELTPFHFNDNLHVDAVKISLLSRDYTQINWSETIPDDMAYAVARTLDGLYKVTDSVGNHIIFKQPAIIGISQG